MKILIYLVCIWLVCIVFTSNKHHPNSEELLNIYHCDPQLYNMLGKPSIIEVSLKRRYRQSQFDDKRYTIPLTVHEFYELDNRINVIEYLGFDPKIVDKFIESESPKMTADIILGVDDKIGKIYIDHGGKIKCLETSGSVKTYNEIFPYSGIFRVIRNGDETTGEYHIRVKPPIKFGHNSWIYWIGINNGELTNIYIR